MLGLPSVRCRPMFASTTQNREGDEGRNFGRKLPLRSGTFAMDQGFSLTDVGKERPPTGAFTNDMSPHYQDTQQNSSKMLVTRV